MDCCPSGSPVYGISKERILEWVAISFSRGSFQPRDRIQVSCIAAWLFTNWAAKEALAFSDEAFYIRKKFLLYKTEINVCLLELLFGEIMYLNSWINILINTPGDIIMGTGVTKQISDILMGEAKINHVE